MEDNITRIVYILNNTEGCTELSVVADKVEKINGWILAVLRNQVVGGVHEEHLKAFYLADYLTAN